MSKFARGGGNVGFGRSANVRCAALRRKFFSGLLMTPRSRVGSGKMLKTATERDPAAAAL